MDDNADSYECGDRRDRERSESYEDKQKANEKCSEANINFKEEKRMR